MFSALGLFGYGCDKPLPERDDNGRPIKMLTVGAARSGWVREYPGTVAAAQEVELGFEVPGQVIKLQVAVGQAIEMGEVIAALDKTNFQATVEAARAQVTAADSDFRRKRELFKIGGASGVALEEAKRRLTTANSDLTTAQKALGDTVLKAPFDGVVARTLVENFQNIRQKQAVVTFQDQAWMEVKVNVPEADAVLAVPGLSLGERNRRLKPEVIVSALPGRKFSAQITEFATIADPATRTYEVTLVFSGSSDVSVLPGMTARAVIEPRDIGNGSTGIRIAAQAVAGDDKGEPYVWVIGQNMKATKRPVKLGEMAGAMVQIVDGLATGERIAVTGVHHLREGLAVRRWEAK